MTTRFDEIMAEVNAIPNIESREEHLMHLFLQLLKENNIPVIEEITQLVVFDGDKPRKRFSAYLRVAMVHTYLETLKERHSEADEDNEDEIVIKKRLYQRLINIYTEVLKWIVCDLPMDVDLSLEALVFYNTLMARFVRDGPLPAAILFRTMMAQSIYLGDEAAAQENFYDWQSARIDSGFVMVKDYLAGTHEEEAHDLIFDVFEQIRYLNFIGHHEQAVSTGRRAIARFGEEHYVLGYPIFYVLIDSMIALGDWISAEEYLFEALDFAESDIDEFGYMLPPLMRMAKRLGLQDEVIRLDSRYHDAIIERSEIDKLLRLDYYLAMMAIDEAYQQKAYALASEFDKRNGNSYYLNRWRSDLQEMQRH